MYAAYWKYLSDAIPILNKFKEIQKEMTFSYGIDSFLNEFMVVITFYPKSINSYETRFIQVLENS